MTYNDNNNNNELYKNPTYHTADNTYFNENISKPKSKKPGLLSQMIIVSVVSSIISGALVGSYFQLISPAVNSANKQEQTSTQSIQSYDSSSKAKMILAAESSDSSITDIAEKVSPSIVGIRVTVPSTRKNNIFGNYFFNGQEQSQTPKAGEGSGIIIKNDGYIMTNDHVIADAINSKTGKLIDGAKIEVYLSSKNDVPYTAQVVGRDSLTDLAVIKIDAKNLPAAKLGNSDNIKVGELAIAIGNPGGLEYMGSVTVGVISGINRKVEGTETTGFKLIQTDAAINPGNSGGALVNSRGEIIGINSVKIVAQGFESLGFAIPVNKAMEIVNSLIQYKYVKGRIQLGITGDINYTEEIAKQYDMPAGVYVSDVQMFSSAYKAGIRKGDIITKFDGVSVKSVNDINDIKLKHKVGDVVSVEIYRDNETLTLKVTLAESKN
ncbi:S1C family serine protease [Pseudobacteroides cellulosolvens]|uniref:HtrA2 peptidase n=1 Tax=Pseudobacteroides cellulosolvens ATCC 35603 = DSM 2933 TaxID=398512 RepID=A0A0L6JVX3_9FIRM|nr:trypsin-like peptidase domain-containing protein [Pseudobacteroides cellulosolvens]KNY29587.1 HtrA2 peptidase [Pseudobacteroides cellulosolvens ATCC 35603 = DSM 2933]